MHIVSICKKKHRKKSKMLNVKNDYLYQDWWGEWEAQG